VSRTGKSIASVAVRNASAHCGRCFPSSLAAIAALVLAILLGAPARAQEQILVEFGSTNTYLANTTDPGIGMDWVDPLYPDGAWDTGTYGIGFDTAFSAQSLLQTSVPPGSLSIFTRATFDVAELSFIDNLWFGSDHDDGIAVWLNGTEIYRSAEIPPTDPLTWNTTPVSSESSNAEQPVYAPLRDVSSVALPLLQAGENVLAVAVWNSTAASSDLVLVPQLVANKDIWVTRGPYLQLGTPTGVTVRWRTDTLQNSKVLYGSSPETLSSSAVDLSPALEHEVTLGGLQPGTRYYYAVGNTSETLAGADAEHFFETSPEVGTPKPTRIWVLGDSGTSGSIPVRDAYTTVTGSRHTDLWLMLGDNAYPIGSDLNYQYYLFDQFPDMLRKSVLWPSIGNHDVSSTASPVAPYFDIFTLPGMAQAGGLASGTESYYSFDYANIHFVVLDSQGSDRAAPPSGLMLDWLQNDLAVTDQEWIIAYWHHPPYSDGSHNSDGEIELIEMRENAVPILESYGVDLVLCGHSHSYERSLLMDQHYGDSTSFGPQHVLDAGTGREDESGGPYEKPYGLVPHQGTVYTVAGTSSHIAPAPLQHPAMPITWTERGSLILEVHGTRLDLSFLDTMGGVLDYFTLIKGDYCPGADADADGVCDPDDSCPDDYDPEQENADGDDSGDACDPCPQDPDDDSDLDGYCADVDNCPDTTNPNQTDTDGDGIGEICDDCPADPDNDVDSDGHCGDVDNCPQTANPNQADADSDGRGDVCDFCPNDPGDDVDGDLICGDVDNCVSVPNVAQNDADSDGIGDPCDPCPLDAGNDADGDLVCGNVDNCPGIPNDQSDGDTDGVGDACDPCPLDPDNDFDQDGRCAETDNCPGAHNPDQTDSDSDGFGDACDSPDDADGDSVPDAQDNCPGVSNPAQQDADGDGQGDACESDDDGDGVPDAADCAPLLPGVSALPDPIGTTLRLGKDSGTWLYWNRTLQGPVSHVYLGIPGPGHEYSGSLTCVDFGNLGTESLQTENPPLGQLYVYVVSAANVCGEGPLGQGSAGSSRSTLDACPLSGDDADGDNTVDLADNCPLVHNPAMSDVDADSVGDVCDNCPSANNTDQADSDSDGRGDACAGLVDGDGDGIEDFEDNCPAIFNTTQDDTDQDGAGDVCDDDDDNDGVLDESDPAPLNPNVCGDTDDDSCDDCSIGVDGFGPLPDGDPANDGTDTDMDGECDAGDDDDDGDGIEDGLDPAPLDPFVCGDTDVDSCDDCSGAFSLLLDAGFDTDAGGLVYEDDPFRGTTEPFYADGTYEPGGGFTGGGLRVFLGGIDPADIIGMSGGWRYDFSLPLARRLTLSFRHNMTQDGSYENDEFSQVLLSFDGTLIGTPPDDYIAQIVGDGNNGPDLSSGWQQFEIDLGFVPAGAHSLVLGGYNNQKTQTSEWTEVLFDDSVLMIRTAQGSNPLDDGPDFDSDGLCDAGDPDDDNDGVDDPLDSDPLDPFVCSDADGDGCDDCASGTYNPDEDGTDTDSDGVCDAADADDDNDGVPDTSDPAPLNPDLCGDTDGDTCDDCSVGTDGFGPLADNDPSDDGADNDADGQCDAGDADDDNDGVDDPLDSDPLDPFVCRDADTDSCDDCVSGTDNPANDGTDTDSDGQCDAGDPDDDNDGVNDPLDSAPLDPFVCRDADGDSCDDCTSGTDNPADDGTDTDADGSCDAGDADDDNDGVDDPLDSAPLDPFVCRDADADDCDDCSSGTDDPANDGTDTDADGACDAGDDDDDNDGVPDVTDPAPLDPDLCGDTDGDSCDDCSIGTDDFGPLADNDPNDDGADNDADGLCDAGDDDDDNDGVIDTLDSAPFDPFVCRDADTDTCDDCTSGTDNPADDGTDTDADGLCDAGDRHLRRLHQRHRQPG